ncbi:hypothetical protein EXS56_01830 [Candidatus Kaiserbacteria bacterium]|nr:hypothetical protein [Candidatus Kaiserbacteria bacterium]
MIRRKLLMTTAALAFGIMPVLADAPPPPPPDPDPVPQSTQSNTNNGRGNKWKGAVKKALINGAICTVGGVILDNVAGLKPSFFEKFADGIVCSLAGAIIPIPGLGGFFGLVATKTICCGKQSIVVKASRDGGFTCRRSDADFVPGCREYLEARGIKFKDPRDKNAVLAMNLWANRQ